jgi:hypothetical protein
MRTPPPLTRRPILALLLGLGPACTGGPDQAITKNNAEPTARILSHINGDRVLDGVEVTFRGTGTDPDDGPENLRARWLLDGVELCAEAAINLDGTVVCLGALSVADGGLLSLEVRDDDNATALAQVQLEVLSSAPPTASIATPVEGTHYYADQLIDVLAQVDDPESPPGELAVEWSLGGGGAVDLPGPDSAGLISGAVLVETVFSWPGLGTLAFESILGRDYPTLLGVLFFSAVLVIAANLMTDFAYRLIDPRLRSH